MSEVLDTDRDVFKEAFDRPYSSFCFSVASGISGAAGNMIEIVFCGKRVEKC